MAPAATVTKVTIASPPVVEFTVHDAAGKPVVGLGNTTVSNGVTRLANVYFTMAKLIPAQKTNYGGKEVITSPSKWVSYLVTTPATAAQLVAAPTVPNYGTRPTQDREGTLVDNGDGSYKYTFYRDITKTAANVAGLVDTSTAKKADLGSATDLKYDPAATHRLGIQIGGTAPGTGSNYTGSNTAPAGVSMVNPANLVYDFVPAGGKPSATRDIAVLDSCSDCHAGKVLAHGSRKDPNYCVTCHTDQRKWDRTEASGGLVLTGSTYRVNSRAVGDFPNLVHKLHMGEELVKTGYNYGGLALNETLYPQPVSNCVKCHDGSTTAKHPTANGDNWMGVPNALACGACHDGIDFASGTGVTLADKAADMAAGKPIGTTQSGHVGGAVPDNSTCGLCHTSAVIPIYHVTVDPTGSNGRGAYNGVDIPLASQLNLPAGVYKVDFEIKQVTVSGAAGAKKATVVYRVLSGGTPVTFNTTGYLMPNVDGTPDIYVAYAMPQDGVEKPADWNTTTSAHVIDIRDGKNGTQTGPDANGYYTATLAATIPDNALLVTAGLGINYNGLVQLNVAAYPKGIRLREPKFAMKAADGYAARRSIVSADSCNNCHGQLGVSPSFHSGARNNGEGCAFCHDPNRATGHTGANNSFGGGWSVQTKNLVHAIHASSKREQPFTYEATAANPNGFQEVGYPGVLNKCEQCHVPGSYDFSGSANKAALPNLLWTTDARGDMSNPTSAPSIGLSPWVTWLGAGQVDYRTNNLVSSPLSAACFGCHDSKASVSHMQLNGGTLVTQASTVTVNAGGDRGNGFTKVEACTVCHGSGKQVDIAVVHR